MATSYNNSAGQPGVYSSVDWDQPVSGLTPTSATTLTDNISTGGIDGSWYVQDSTVNVHYVPEDYHRYESSIGTAIHFDFEIGKDKVIHPRLYFKFVKSKLTKLEERKLNKRLFMLQKFVKSAEDMGQQALYETFAKKIAITVREQELWACGIEYFVDRKYVDQFMDKVKDVEIGFSKLENFDRPLPTKVANRVKKVKKLELFDELWVLYLNYKEKKDVDGKKKKEKKLKTNKEKIKEKDPILFGIQSHTPDKLYYIIDWIDEHCDLTLDKFIEDIKKSDPDYDLDRIDDINPRLIKKIVKESREQYKRLEKTNMKNYKSLMKEEDEKRDKKSIVKRVKGFFEDMKSDVMDKIKKGKK